MTSSANSASARGDWAVVAERLGADLLLDLAPDPDARRRGRGSDLRSSLGAALRSAIAEGRLATGATLPPYRSLAADLGVSRGTVSAAYQDLITEGWLVARQGSGTRVAARPTPSLPAMREATSNHQDPPLTAAATSVVRHDFSLGQPTSSRFPRSDWARATRHVMTTAPNTVFGPSAANGSSALRIAITGYLARVRGVRTHPDNVVLTTSVMSGLELLTRSVLGPTVAVESYGLPFHRDRIRRWATTVPIHVDETGGQIDELDAAAAADRPSAAVLTPSHQYPTGSALDAARRIQVIDWARRTGAIIVEDDYDGELRYDRTPIGALAGLAPESVIYVGSASKTLSPAVRIAWLVLPPHLVGEVMHAKGIREPDASIVDQLVFAEMIENGAYDRHIRSSRQHYRRRRDHLTRTLSAAGIDVRGIAAGLHAVIDVPADLETAVVAAARDRGFVVSGLDEFRHPAARRTTSGGVVVGFGTPTDSRFAADVDALVGVLGDYLPNRRLRAAKSRSARRKSTRRNSGQ